MGRVYAEDVACMVQAYVSCLAKLPQADGLVTWVETKRHNRRVQMPHMSQHFWTSRIFQVSGDTCLDLSGWTRKDLWVSCHFEGRDEVIMFSWSFNALFVMHLVPRIVSSRAMAHKVIILCICTKSAGQRFHKNREYKPKGTLVRQ